MFDTVAMYQIRKQKLRELWNSWSCPLQGGETQTPLYHIARSNYMYREYAGLLPPQTLCKE